MSTLLVRILRFGWFGSIILTLAAVATIGVAAAVAVSHPSVHASASSAGLFSPPSSIGVSVTTTAQVVPIDPSHRPASDHEFIAVSVQLTNARSQASDFSASEFVLRDQTGTVFDPDPAGSYLVGAAALPSQGTLQPGAHRSGAIVFEVPMSDHTAMLLWQPTGATMGSGASWMISI